MSYFSFFNLFISHIISSYLHYCFGYLIVIFYDLFYFNFLHVILTLSHENLVHFTFLCHFELFCTISCFSCNFILHFVPLVIIWHCFMFLRFFVPNFMLFYARTHYLIFFVLFHTVFITLWFSLLRSFYANWH